MTDTNNRRVLLVDDMHAIHEDFRKVLTPERPRYSEFGAAEAALFGEVPTRPSPTVFELDSAYQGQEGLAKVEASLRTGRPYAMAFVDMRMPPGWDGMQTIEQLWATDPRLQIVVCTAYSDASWEDIMGRLDARDRLVILKKPFDAIEVHQLANMLTAKWQMAQQAAAHLSQLEVAVHHRTQELTRANLALEDEVRERKHLQGQMIQSEKLASIGQLAAGVAHEINNPIGYIFSNFGALETYMDKLFEMLAAYERAEPSLQSADVATALRKMRDKVELDYLKEDIPVLMRESKQGIERVRRIVQDLKDFARVDSMQDLQWANLHQGIDSTLNVVASEVKYKADVVKDYGAIPDIECLPSQINQVVMNLVVNAAQSMGSERGLITVKTGLDGEHVWLEVADNGSGMPAETLQRIFEPFFTTKPVGKGTGLGLSLSHGIVSKHHGSITVESTPGRGTTFRIVLPIRQLPVSRT